MHSKHCIVIPTENDYVKSVFTAFHRFLIEEVTRCVYAYQRLKNALNAVRNLYSAARKKLRTRPYFGQFDRTNTELLFDSATGKEGCAMNMPMNAALTAQTPGFIDGLAAFFVKENKDYCFGNISYRDVLEQRLTAFADCIKSL